MPGAVADGEWWRLLTGGFLHFGPIHLLFNMMALWVIGRDVEPALGRGRFLAVYLVSLLGGSTAVMLLSAPNALVAGASGAVFGLMGALAVLLRRLRIPLGQVGRPDRGQPRDHVPAARDLGGRATSAGWWSGAVATAALVYAPADRRRAGADRGARRPHAAAARRRRAAHDCHGLGTDRPRASRPTGTGGAAPLRRRPPGRRRGPAGRTPAAARCRPGRPRPSPASSSRGPGGAPPAPARRRPATTGCAAARPGHRRSRRRASTRSRGRARVPYSAASASPTVATAARSRPGRSPVPTSSVHHTAAAAAPAQASPTRPAGGLQVPPDTGAGLSFTERDQLSTDVVHTGDDLSPVGWTAQRHRMVISRPTTISANPMTKFHDPSAIMKPILSPAR